MRRERDDCVCESSEEDREVADANRTAYINRLRLEPITSVIYLNQQLPKQSFYFQTPLRNVIEARFEMVWSQYINASDNQPMVALYCSDLSAYQRTNQSGSNDLGQQVVNKDNIIWLQPIGTLTAPSFSEASRIAWQNTAHDMRFMVAQDIHYLNLTLDSYPIKGNLLWGAGAGEEPVYITWKLITRHLNSG